MTPWMDTSLLGVHSSDFFDASPVATFVIDTAHVVTHFNQACALTLGISAALVLGQRGIGKIFHGDDRAMMVDLIIDGKMEQAVSEPGQSMYRRSSKVAFAYEAEVLFPALGEQGRWLFFTAAPIYNAHHDLVAAIETVQDITDRKVAEQATWQAKQEVDQIVEQRTQELMARNQQLQALNDKLSQMKEQLIQSEKLASIGQLAAGIAHEINNPIGYIFSNFGSLETYLKELLEMLEAYQRAEPTLPASAEAANLKAKREAIDLEYLKEDIPALMRESREGIVRVRKIVQDLKDFSHVDANPQWQLASLNQGIESTLNVINNEIKYKADLVKDLADLPAVQCMPSQINQVVMNLVVNAAHSIGAERGLITVRTRCEGEQVWLEVTDTGSGIAPEVLPRIFDPFYTTKPVGKGTGLGLSLSYGIVQKHHGSIDVQSEPGKGSTFRVTLPLHQPDATVVDGTP